MYGVANRACVFPSQLGMYESSPATNGIRAEPASQADPIPAMEILSISAKGAMIQSAPTRLAMWLTACTIPCSTLMSFLLTAISSVSVVAMYITPERIPPQATAPGSVFCGSLISSPITDANSKPTSPKQITPNEFNTNRGFGGIRKSAAVTVVPNLAKTITPNPIKTAAAMAVPIPPKLLIHFPTPSPTIFRITSSAIRPTDATTVNILLSASAAWPGPSTKTETPTK